MPEYTVTRTETKTIVVRAPDKGSAISDAIDTPENLWPVWPEPHVRWEAQPTQHG